MKHLQDALDHTDLKKAHQQSRDHEIQLRQERRQRKLDGLSDRTKWHDEKYTHRHPHHHVCFFKKQTKQVTNNPELRNADGYIVRK